MAKDYYQILGLQRGATADDVKKAYRKLSKELHPDKHKGDAEAERRFKEVNEAYEVLNNPQKKQMYDQFGEAGVNGSAGAGGGQGFSGFDFGEGNFGGFGDIFESFFRGGGRQAAATGEGRDLETETTIELSEAVTGVRHDVKLRRLRRCDRCTGNGAEPNSKLVTCSECGGTGQVTRTAQSFFGAIQQRFVCPKCQGSGKIPEKPCTKCSGEGRVSETDTVPIDIPAGIADGQSLRLRGEGEAGRQGGTAGDLYVHIRVRADRRFKREGDDIHSEISIDALDAILGRSADVDTVRGSVTLTIPEGTQPGQIFRMKGKGMPVLNTSRSGDHFVTVKVNVPTRLSREERKILESWKSLLK